MAFRIAATILTVMIPYTLMYTIADIEDKSGWSQLRATLPISRKETVLGRYATAALVSFATMIGTIVVITVCYLIMQGLSGIFTSLGQYRLSGEAFGRIVTSSFCGTCVTLFLCGIMLPLAMKFGMTKAARYITLAFILFIILGTMLVSFIQSHFGFRLVTALDSLSSVIPFAGILVFLASIPLSLYLYRTREL